MQLPLIPNPDPNDGEASPGGAGGAAALPGLIASAERLIAWAKERFSGETLIITTGFGLEGCAMIDIIVRVWREAPVVAHYLDTHFLFEETHDLRRALESRYPTLRLVNAGTSLTSDQQALKYGAELWKSNPDRCCELRKVEPMRALLTGASAWMTAIRRTQSLTRAEAMPVSTDAQFGVTKLNPLVDWSREQVWEYVRTRGVPYNVLHLRGYPSIGCTHCTRAVAGSTPAQYSRDGRWSGQGKTECGLHWNTSASGSGAKPQSADRNEELP